MDNKHITVLLVEDNPADALLIKYTIGEIEWLPVKLIAVDSLSKAFVALQEQAIDLILLDLILPDSSGRSTFDKLIAFNDRIPIVILSGLNSRDIALEAIKEGAQDYLVKGEIDGKLLERTVRYAIERAKLINAQKKIQQDIRDQDELLKLITKISATFINLSSEQIDQAIKGALYTIGDFLEADKVFVFELNETTQQISTHYQWSSLDAEQKENVFTNLSTEGYQWVLQQLHENGMIIFYDSKELPPESGNLREILLQQSILSFMVSGLFYQNQITALLGLATIHKQGHWSSETISLLNTSGEVFYRAIKKKQAEERIKESERKYRTLVENLDEGLIYVDANEKIQFANQSICNMLGYTYEEIIGKNFINDIFLNQHNTNGLLKIPQNSRGLLLAEQYEIAIRKKNGEKVWVIVNNHPIINDNGKKIGAMGTLVNITDRKKVEERLKKANDELKTFIYRTSHDLRGPLASVLGITNLATMEITDPRALQYFSYINKSTQKLDKTLKALIDVASITQPDEVYTSVDFKEIINEVIETMNYTNSLENISILLEVNQQTSFISSKQLLTYIFEKLIENAICYRKPDINDPKLSIQIHVGKEEAKIDIKDNGIGIPKDLQQKVFNMFFKGVEKSRGSGLGLYIVDKLVSSLNGTIELESEPNIGTHFTIHLKSL